MTTTMRERFQERFLNPDKFSSHDLIHPKYAAGLIGHMMNDIEDFIKQELKKEREEIIEWIEKQDWECFEQTFITKDIINTIKNRYEQSTNRTK